MSERMTPELIPAEGRTVPFEDGTAWPLDDKGKPVPTALPATRYVRRRLRDSDLIPATPDAAPDTPAPEPDTADEDEPAADAAATKTPSRSGRRREKTED